MSAAENKAVFLSYASQDAEAAKRIADALRAAGVEVWFDAEGGLEHGDEWDAKIRKQVKECVLFIAVISANTQAREEGYFRIEWELAAQRALGIASGVAFILPVVIDGTREPEALVPDRFRSVQWTKLPGGAVPPEVLQRFLKLWSHRTGVLKHEAVSVAGRGEAGPGSPPPAAVPSSWKSKPAGLRYALAALAVLVLGVGLFFAMKPRRSPEEIAKLSASAQALGEKAAAQSSPAPAPLSEARQLVAQARQLWDAGDEVNRDTYSFPEELLKRAVALDPLAADAWALGAQISGAIVWYEIDPSSARKDLFRRQVDRARSLAPDSVETKLAFASWQRQLGQDLSGAESELLSLAHRFPGDWRVQRELGLTYRDHGRVDAALRALERARELSRGDTRVVNDLAFALLTLNRFADAEKMVADGLARRPIGRLLASDVMLKTRWRGDLAGAQAAIKSWPEWLLLEDRGAFAAWQSFYWNRQPDKALAVVQRITRDYMRDPYFAGPRAVLTARAHEQAGHAEAARADWREAVEVADRVLASAPDDASALHWKAWALARLGDPAGAGAISAQMLQRNTPGQASFYTLCNIAPFWATVGRADLALEDIRARRAEDVRGYALPRAALKLDPAFDALRSDPRFQELVKSAFAPEETAASIPTVSAVDLKSVAVLAFANLSDDKGNEYFSDGISEDLLNLLGKVPGLRVAARASAFSFKGKDATAQEMGQKLNVVYLVDGSVQRSGMNVRVVSRLSRADTGEQIWSEKFDGDLKNIFALQDEIAAKIAENLKLKLAVSARAARPVNPEAYRLYLLGRHQWEMNTEAGTNRAVQCFEQAIQLDPTFALAHCGLSDTYNYFGGFTMPGRDAWQKEIAQAQKALTLDPDLADAHVSLGIGLINAMRLHDAELTYKRAGELNPNLSLIYDGRAFIRLIAGRCDEAVVESRKSVELDPLSEWMNGELVMFLYLGRRFDEAKKQAQRALELHPDSVWAYQTLGWVALAQGQPDTAIAHWQAAVKLDPSPSNLGDLGHAYAVSGHRAEAEEILNRMASLAKQRYVTPSVWLKIHLGFGDIEAAFSWLEKCSAVQDPVCWYINSDQRYDRLREDPRCRALLIKAGLTDEQLR